MISLGCLAFVGLLASGVVSDAEKFHSTAMNPTPAAAERKAEGGVKVIFVGNSITLHGPCTEIGWTNNFGMAASAPEKDYVHLVTRDIERRFGRPADVTVRNYADFERNFRTWDVRQADELVKLTPDVLVVALGENVPTLATQEDKLAYRDAFKRLLGAFLDGRNTKPLAVVRGCFWRNDDKDWAMAYAASDYAIPFVKADVSGLPGMGAENGGYSHEGIQAHPGDRGMAEIAARVLEGLFPEKTGYSAWMDGTPVRVRAMTVSAMEFNRIFDMFQRPADQTERAGYVAVEATGATAWRVKADRGFTNAVLRPLSAKVRPVAKDGTVTFTLPKCGHYVLELDDYHRPLEIFVEPKNDFTEYRRTATRTFGPGPHLAGAIRLKSHDRVYIDKDAVVYGGFVLDDVEDVEIRGYGVICGTTCRRDKPYGTGILPVVTPVRAQRSRKITIEGPIVLDACEWCVAFFGCRDVDVSHVKVTGAWRYNTDGVDLCNSQNVRLADSYVHSFDDTVAVKGLLPFRTLPVENVKVERCVGWCGWGRSFENGLETWASAWRNVVFEDCDLIHNSMVALSLQLGGPCAVEDVTFRNIRLEYDASRSRHEYQEKRDDVYTRTAIRPWIGHWFAAFNEKMFAPGSMYGDAGVSPDEPNGSFKRCLLEDIDIRVDDGVPLPKHGVWFEKGTTPGGVEFRNVRMNGNSLKL